MNNAAGRIEFIRHFYSLLQLELDQDEDQDTRSAIHEFNIRIEGNLVQSVCTKDDNGGRKRTRTGTGNTTGSGHLTGEGGGDDRAQLRAQGYEVKPEVVVDASGGELAPLYKVSAICFDLFAMLTLDPRGRIIFSLCIDPWIRTRNSSRRKFGRVRRSLRCSDFLIPFHRSLTMSSR